jgi:hypothetical protein
MLNMGFRARCLLVRRFDVYIDIIGRIPEIFTLFCYEISRATIFSNFALIELNWAR